LRGFLRLFFKKKYDELKEREEDLKKALEAGLISTGAGSRPPSGVCNYDFLGSGKYCERKFLEGYDKCYWHARTVDKYKPEVIKSYFQADITLKKAVETEVIQGNSLAGAYLRQARIGGYAFERGADLSKGDLRGGNFSEAHLSYGSLRSALLQFANFESAFLSDVDIRDANFTGAVLYNVKFRDNDFSGVTGLTKNCFRGWKWGFIPVYRILEQYPEFSKYAYMAMKTHFTQNGAINDASWSAYRELISDRHLLLKSLSPITAWTELIMSDYVFEQEEKPFRLALDFLIRWIERFFSLMTSYISCFIFGYGEKPFRVITTSFITIMVYAAIFDKLNVLPESGLRAALYFSMVTFSTLGYGDLAPRKEYRLFAASEALVGLILVGLFLFSLSRRR